MCIDDDDNDSKLRGFVWNLRNGSRALWMSDLGDAKPRLVLLTSTDPKLAPRGATIRYQSDMGHVLKCNNEGRCYLHPLDAVSAVTSFDDDFVDLVDDLAKRIKRKPMKLSPKAVKALPLGDADEGSTED